jgi:hypothetical protein
LAILGGTGKLGSALALRWARAGYHVVVGSRQLSKAQRVAAELNAKLGREVVAAAENGDAARRCDIAVLTVPYSAHRATLEAVRSQLRGKLLICTTVPIDPAHPAVASLPSEGGAAQMAQAIVGPEVPVAAALHHVSFEHLRDEETVDSDVLVCADSDEARSQTVALIEAAAMAAMEAGPLANAAVLEGFTSILIGINRRYRIRGAGIRITGRSAPASTQTE